MKRASLGPHRRSVLRRPASLCLSVRFFRCPTASATATATVFCRSESHRLLPQDCRFTDHYLRIVRCPPSRIPSFGTLRLHRILWDSSSGRSIKGLESSFNKGTWILLSTFYSDHHFKLCLFYKGLLFPFISVQPQWRCTVRSTLMCPVLVSQII